MAVPQQVIADLRYVFGWFPLDALLHLRANRHRLTRGVYSTSDGKGCLFNLLSEALPADQRIDHRTKLTRFFTGGSGFPYCEQAEYQPARWLVRLIDGTSCPRYGGARHLPWDVALDVLDEVIAEREAAHQAEALVGRRASRRLAGTKARAAVT